MMHMGMGVAYTDPAGVKGRSNHPPPPRTGNLESRGIGKVWETTG